MLAQLVSHSGGTPQVPSSTPRGSKFQPEGKKIPSLAPVPMHWCGRPRSAWGPLHGPGRVPMGYGPQCQGGARVRGFSRSGKPRLLLESQYRWGGLSPPGRVFFSLELQTWFYTASEVCPTKPANMILYGQADISLHSLMSSAYKGTMKFYVWIILLR